MEADGLGYRNLHFYDPHVKNNLGLHLSLPAEHRTKPFLSNGGFLYRDCDVSQSSMPCPTMQMEFVRDTRIGWMCQRDGSNAGINYRDGNISGINHRDGNISGVGHRVGSISGLFHRTGSLVMDHTYNISGISHRENNMSSLLTSNPDYAAILSSTADSHTLQMLQPPNPLKDNNGLVLDDTEGGKEAPLKKKNRRKKKSESKPDKTMKLKKPKKTSPTKDDSIDPSAARVKVAKKSTSLVINGFNIDLSGIPPPVCSCTGSPQQCYRWGAGGWQSACCTTNMSVYPLPMSSKRKGARIAGRKMSQGAFKKVLEKLAGDGHQFKDPIDLKLFWAKHGTNKFVTIRSTLHFKCFVGRSKRMS